MKKTWILPHGAVESFGRMFLDDFDVLKLYLWNCMWAAGIFGENLFTVEEHWKEKTYSSFQDM